AQARFMTRDRHVDGLQLAAVEPSPVRVPSRALTLGPNPLQRGAELELRLVGALPSASTLVDFYDVSGRRLTSVPLSGSRSERFARVSGGSISSWPAGLYFARVRDSGASARLVLLR
ncbi:MAG: T9SS type A sorting domain-containing protein, partial [Candidatus Eiseniibacteriota bacterium]